MNNDIERTKLINEILHKMSNDERLRLMMTEAMSRTLLPWKNKPESLGEPFKGFVRCNMLGEQILFAGTDLERSCLDEKMIETGYCLVTK